MPELKTEVISFRVRGSEREQIEALAAQYGCSVSAISHLIVLAYFSGGRTDLELSNGSKELVG